MKQGEIWYASLDPVQGSEQAGYRPVVIISGNLLNKHLQIVIAVPLTTKIKNYTGNPIISPNPENGLKDVSEMMVFHIRSISKQKLIQKIGNITDAELKLALTTLKEITTF